MDLGQVENNIGREAVIDVYKDMLAQLYYNSCNCLRDDPEAEDLYAPKFHKEDCPYRLSVEEAELDFVEEETI